jgi:hypothetical protein
MSEISLVHQKLQITDVKLITVSDIVDDNGEQLRIVKFYGDPVQNGAPTAFVEIACRASVKENLEIQAPGFKY